MNDTTLKKSFIDMLLALCLSAMLWILPAYSQSSCDKFYSLNKDRTLNDIEVVPDAQLENWKVAVPCLLQSLARLNTDMMTDNRSETNRAQLLSLVVALRKIQVKLEAEGRIKEFIEEMRKGDSIESASALTFGGRDVDRDIRLNSMLLLSNTIDNTTVCVPLTHLADDGWQADSADVDSRNAAVSGRVNLLAIVSVVAPWAYKENFDSMEKIVAKIEAQIRSDLSDLETTKRVLGNLKERMASQTQSTNKNYQLKNLPFAASICANYVMNYKPPLSAEQKLLLKYG